MEDFLKKKIDDLIGSGENKKPLIIVVHPTNNPNDRHY